MFLVDSNGVAKVTDFGLAEQFGFDGIKSFSRNTDYLFSDLLNVR